MEVAFHSGLARAQTHHPSSTSSTHSRMNSSAGPPALMHSNSHQSYQSQYSSFSHSTARDTQSTQATSTSTLFGPGSILPTSTPVNGGPIEAANNVLNKRADEESSLFKRCLTLHQRLRAIPGFERWMIEEENKADDDADPVTLLWRMFRRGYPLMEVYNALGPKVRLSVDEAKVNEKTRAKAASYKFIQACVNELKFPSEECFIISDLYGDDTTGFVKVTSVVNRVLDILVQMGIITTDVVPSDASTTSTIKRTQREHIIDELVKTERTYVQHLELLQSFKKLVEEKGVITGDSVHDIFLNLNALLDFQRRFLIRVEQTNAQSADEQNWGNLFVLYKDAFKVYEPYIANQKKCEEVAMREFEKLRETGGSAEMQQMVESPTHLTSFLLKPFQRLAKYPLLLKELRDKGDLDEGRKSDISKGIEAASTVLQSTNAAIDREERLEAVEELKTLVEDWKGHRIEGFGDLLLYGQFTVLKGETVNSKNEEREYKIYLFEMILLCCKEINPNKQKNRMMNKPLTNKNGKPKLQLKGRIFMQNVTETISLQKPGSYTCQIFWKGDPGIENFIIRFNSEETMKKWAMQVDTQRRMMKEYSRSSGATSRSQPSNTEFLSMQDHRLTNPYAEHDDDDEDEDVDTVVPGYPGPHNNYGMRSTGSSLSLRSRSTTGGSGPPMEDADSRVPPPRFPIGNPPLTLRTQQLQSSGNPDSYFSPTAESPMSGNSIRTTSSGTFPFPRQQPPGGYYSEDNNRHTAPAMPRGPMTREGSVGPGGYPTSRGMQRPSLPPNAGSAIMNQNRMRSASSPDIHNANGPGRRLPNGQQAPVPEVPPFPTHYAYNSSIATNRSQSGSPNGLPPRAATQSPAIQRDRLIQQRTAEQLAQADYHAAAARRDPGHASLSRTMTPASSFERTMTPASVDSRMSPPLSQTPTPHEMSSSGIPTQLKVKVHCPSAGSTMTLVVSTNISFQSLKDRIDAKLQRSTSVSLSTGQVKLKYLDDDDYVSIQSDEDVQTAFETWKEQQRDLNPGGGQLGEIDLYCQR
ncbi:Pleckstrin homology domain-domain-containing protein [Clohesyomyces aquaticus]|uniref:Pleckstrin homology domain-domain-containing protein n=1 Tax=Clohesyomyces aquaticus TaxID=1231657 RepID=A0A1Y1ZX41_9PLEO|nr:Pleckstrin homology domain-domain-containing protein [Clohesyomyces aquaticus]